jgi:hypothetical protein
MKKIFLFLTISTFLSGQELFTIEKISIHLDKENPFVSTLLNKEEISKEKIKYYESAFDTKLVGKHDKKEYPASEAEYSELFLKKRIGNGLEFLAGYRVSEGVQEYNNIKTGKDGEMMLGVKMPLTNLFAGTNQQKTDLDVSVLESEKNRFGSKDGLRLLFFEVLKSYYILLFNQISLQLENELLEKAEKRQKFIYQKVKVGLFPEIAKVEAQQILLNRKQRVLISQRDYENSFANFLKFLDLSKTEFEKKYFLQKEFEIETKDFTFQNSISIAKQNRPDLKMLRIEQEKLRLQIKNAKSLKYPNLNLSFYGVHDFKYGEGFKVSFDMEFPFERNKYESKLGQHLKNLQNVEKLLQKKNIEIETALSNIINSFETTKKNISNSEQEFSFVKKLEEAENRKYVLGGSNLFMLNQREIYTLEVKKKILGYKLKYFLLQEDWKAQTGILKI